MTPVAVRKTRTGQRGHLAVSLCYPLYLLPLPQARSDWRYVDAVKFWKTERQTLRRRICAPTATSRYALHLRRTLPAHFPHLLRHSERNWHRRRHVRATVRIERQNDGAAGASPSFCNRRRVASKVEDRVASRGKFCDIGSGKTARHDEISLTTA